MLKNLISSEIYKPNIIMKRNILLILAFAFPALLVAQNASMSFSITEAQNYALENNKTYKNAMADVKLAETQIKEARGAGLPSLEGTLDYMTNFGYELEFSFGGEQQEPPQVDYSKMDLGDFEVLKILEGMSSPGASTIKMTDQSSANIQFSQLVFSGQYWVGLEMARLGKMISEKGLDLTGLEIKEQVINSYYLILVTKKLTEVIESTEENLREMFTHTDNLYKAGMAEKTDVDQIRINISQLENSKRAMERNLELNYNMFRMLLGLDAGTEIELEENLDSILASFDSQLVAADEFNVLNNPNYQMLEVQEKIGEKNIDLHKWAYSPTLIGFYNYKKKIMVSGFDLSPNHAAGFSMSIPIFSGGTKSAQLSKARIELDKTERTKSLLRDQLNLQNRQLQFNLRNAVDNYNTQKESVKVAKEVFNSILLKYQEGIISSLELSQANGNYLQAENNYVSSIMDLLTSKLAIDKLFNNL